MASVRFGTVVLGDVPVTYSFVVNASANRANPHRLTATCVCGVTFLQCGCSDRTARNLETVLRQGLARHQASGYCEIEQHSERSGGDGE